MTILGACDQLSIRLGTVERSSIARLLILHKFTSFSKYQQNDQSGNFRFLKIKRGVGRSDKYRGADCT